MKNNILLLGLIGLLFLVNPCIGQIDDKVKYPADKEELKIDQIGEIINLDVYEETDFHRVPQGQSDSVNTTPMPESIKRKKIRLDAEELKIKLPSVIYEYPDGKLEIDYESLIAILFISYAEDKETIKLLKEEIKELKEKVDKIK